MLDAKFDACHTITAKWEGGWSDHPADPGGKTMYGITQATLSAYLGRPATVQEIRQLTKERAKTIYASEYWDKVAGDALPAGIDLCVYDFGVNSGPSRAVKSLQAALGVKADGWMGQITLAAVLKADPIKLIDTLCDRRLAFLKALPTWSDFGKGWGNRVADIRRQAKRMAAGAKPLSPPAIPEHGTAKALPAPRAEKAVSTEQKVGIMAGTAATITATVGPAAGLWRENKDVLTDPVFLVVAAILTLVVLYLAFRKPTPVEAQE